MANHLLRTEGILPMTASIAFGAAFLALFAHAVYSSSLGGDGAETSQPVLADTKRLRPAVLVTIGWMALYYCFLQGQAAAAFWVHKIRREESNKKDDADVRRATQKPIQFADVKYGDTRANRGLMLTMDRTVGNLLEQTPPFMIALWLHALTASANDAAWYGWLWLLMRASYPIAFAHPSMTPALWGLQRRLGISWVNFVTWPSYFVIWTMIYRTARACDLV